MFRTCAFIVLLVAVGCVATPEQRARVAKSEVGDMEPPLVHISSYRKYVMQKFEFSDAVLSKGSKTYFGSVLEVQFREKLNPLLRKWNSISSSKDNSGTLSIQPTLIDLDIKSHQEIYAEGIYADKAFIHLELRLVDQTTGTIIANQLIRRYHNIWLSRPEADHELFDYITDISYWYLKWMYGRPVGLAADGKHEKQKEE